MFEKDLSSEYLEEKEDEKENEESEEREYIVGERGEIVPESEYRKEMREKREQPFAGREQE